MKIGQTPNIPDNLTCSSVKKQEVRYFCGRKNVEADSFVRKNKPKISFFSNFFDKIKQFFTPKPPQKEQIDISTLNNKESAVSFKGINVNKTKNDVTKELGLSEKEISDCLKTVKEQASLDNICALLELHNISPKELGEEFNRQKELFDGDIECSLLQTVENLKMHTIIPEDSFFTPFKLSMAETEEIARGIIIADDKKVYGVLKKNNPEIGKIFEDEQLLSKYRNTIYQKMALDDFRLINPGDLIDLGKINGRSKKIIFPNATSVEIAKDVNIDADTLIKSNIITMELLEETKDIPLPKLKTANSVSKQKLTFYPEKIREKALKFGIDALTSYEVHALTDCLSDMPEAKKTAEKIIKNKSNPTNKQLRQLSGYINHLKKLSEPILKDSKIKIDDHAYLRMLDRNLVSVADNSQNRLLSFQELVEVIKTAAEEEMKKTSPKNEIVLSDYKDSAGLKLLLKYKDGICTVDSVM
ncbi:hypothetical protein IKQ26_08120 [bacterium]|nr:hypothetical protein [bacterium]